MKLRNTRRIFVAGFLSCAMASGLVAQTITPLHRFTGANDGATPLAGLTVSSDSLYGTALFGGAFAQGTVFSLKKDGVGFTKLRDFRAGNTNSFGVFTNEDGINPGAALALSGGTLYGTAHDGGRSGVGTVFKLRVDGSAFATPHHFTDGAVNALGVLTNMDGLNPAGALLVSGNTLYGTASAGGLAGAGTVFKLRTDGSNFVSLHSFAAGQTNLAGILTNKEGMNPLAAVTLSGDKLFGTAAAGGAGGSGTIFSLEATGAGFSALYSFTPGRANTLGLLINVDGISPVGALVVSGNVLYGATLGGGRWGAGTLYKLNSDGTGFKVIHHFTNPRTNSLGVLVNNDGMNPAGSLVLSGDTLYGVTTAGGMAGVGTAFQVQTDGTGYRVLHAFTPATASTTGLLVNGDGINPTGGLILADGNLYGTTPDGGRGGLGTVFRLTTGGVVSGSSTVDSSNQTGASNENTAEAGTQSDTVTTASPDASPSLTISSAEGGLILSWPVSSPSLTLESTTSLVPPVVWSAVSPGAAQVNGFNIFTNVVSGPQRFYRLRQ